MKSTSIFALGLLVGCALTLAFHRPSQTSSFTIAREDRQATVDNDRSWHPVDRQSSSIDYHKPLFLTDRSGTEFRLYIYGSMGAPLKYEWRSTTNPLEGGGGGKLFENYEVIAEKPDGVEVRDAGGRLAIAVGEHHLEWSAKDQSSGWIYFDAAELKLSNESANKSS